MEDLPPAAAAPRAAPPSSSAAGTACACRARAAPAAGGATPRGGAARCPQCRASPGVRQRRVRVLPDTDEIKQATVERVYGPKLARIWRLLAELDRKRSRRSRWCQLGAE